MKLRAFLLCGLLALPRAGADAPLPAKPAPASPSDPFYLPPEAKAFVLKATWCNDTTRLKLAALLKATFLPRSEGGLGLVYDNSRTRTVAQVWEEGRANCLSLTAFYVMSCRAIGIPEEFAEVLNTNRWTRKGALVHFERHVVALTPQPNFGDMVADFVPELRKRYGTYVVSPLPEPRFRALYYSNLAVEALTAGDLDGAQAEVERSQTADPTCSVGWNVLGVVQEAQGHDAKAEQAYLRAMALDPKDGAPIGNMETLMISMDRPSLAAKYRQLGEQVRKKDPYFHAYLAEEALNEGRLDEAMANIKTALKIIPEEPDFHLLQGRVKLAAGDLDGAQKAIEQAKHYANPSERERYDNKLARIRDMKNANILP